MLKTIKRLLGRHPKRIKTSFALRFYHEVLGLEHLHYGLWDGEALDHEGLRQAQERYLERLESYIL